MSRGHGNRRAQRKRRKAREKISVPMRDEAVLLIDGNWSYFPVAYCERYRAYLTAGLLETHGCRLRCCGRLVEYDPESEAFSS